jgi:AcrR family transcriptional regulator
MLTITILCYKASALYGVWRPEVPADKEIAREKLILAGERLVAERGMEGLSLRQVNIEAGQKNTSAALYHFGDKQNLLLAIFDYRMEHVNQRRHELLDADDSSVRALVGAWIRPDIEEMAEAEGGSYHARFLAVVCNNREFNVDELWNRPHASSYQRIAAGLRKLLPDLPAPIFSQRFGMAMLQSIYAIAEQERLEAAGKTQMTARSPLFVSNLIDVLEAIFSAPLSAETRHELNQ